MTSQDELEQAIANVDKVVAAFQCDRPTGNLVYGSWRRIVLALRELAEPETEPEDTPETEPAAK